MGFFSKLFKGPEIDLEQSAANAARMRGLFDAVVPEGGKYRLTSSVIPKMSGVLTTDLYMAERPKSAI